MTFSFQVTLMTWLGVSRFPALEVVLLPSFDPSQRSAAGSTRTQPEQSALAMFVVSPRDPAVS